VSRFGLCIAFNGASIGITSIGHVSEVVAIESCLLKEQVSYESADTLERLKQQWQGSI